MLLVSLIFYLNHSLTVTRLLIRLCVVCMLAKSSSSKIGIFFIYHWERAKGTEIKTENERDRQSHDQIHCIPTLCTCKILYMYMCVTFTARLNREVDSTRFVTGSSPCPVTLFKQSPKQLNYTNYKRYALPLVFVVFVETSVGRLLEPLWMCWKMDVLLVYL